MLRDQHKDKMANAQQDELQARLRQMEADQQRMLDQQVRPSTLRVGSRALPQ